MKRDLFLISFAVILGYLSLLRSVIYLVIPSFSSIFTIITRYFSILSWALLVLAYYSLKRVYPKDGVKKDRFFNTLQVFTLLLVAYGLFEHNGAKYIFSQYIGLSSVIILFALAQYKGVYEYSLNLLTIIFYVNVLLMFFTKDVVSFSRIGDEFYDVSSDERFTGTVAFTLRSGVTLGYFLTAYAVNTKGLKLARLLQLAAIIFVFYFEVYIFQFRSVLIEISILMIGIIYIKTKARLKLTILISLLLIGIILLFWSESLGEFGVINRFEKGGGIFNAIDEGRNEEAAIMLSQFKIEDYLFGRGLSGSFNATQIYGKNGAVWRGTHYGVLIFLLNGGLIYLFMFIYILLMSARNWLRHYKEIYLCNSPVIIAAWLTFPTILFSIIFNPLGWSQGVVIGLILSLLSLGLAFVGFKIVEPDETQFDN